MTYTPKTADAMAVISSSTTWSNGWYVVKEDVTINNRITVSGEVKVVSLICLYRQLTLTINLILCDGAKLEARSGITMTDATFNIYAQEKGTGQLVATGSDGGAGIGSDNDDDQGGNGGTVTIHGGRVTARGVNGGNKDDFEKMYGGGGGQGGAVFLP